MNNSQFNLLLLNMWATASPVISVGDWPVYVRIVMVLACIFYFILTVASHSVEKDKK